MEESGWFKKSYRGLVKGENSIRHVLLLIIRLYWGGLLVITGLGKWINVHGVAAFFAELNIPFPLFNAYFVGGVEFIGGISLFLGLFARIFSIPLVAVFIVAYVTAHTASLVSFFVNPALFVMQDPFLYLYATLVILCFGSGALSFDHWFEKKLYGKSL